VTIFSYASGGFEGDLVTVEVDLRRGIPGMDIVGLPDSAVRESRERVRAAVRNSGFQVPRERVLINLAPAGVKKIGASFDLPIAAALLESSRQIIIDPSIQVLILGELELSGAVRPVNGVLAAVASAMEAGLDYCLVPLENYQEACVVGRGRIATITHLREIAELGGFFHRTAEGLPRAGESAPLIFENSANEEESPPPIHPPACEGLDYADMVGQEHLKRACEVAAAGRHHMLLFGPPGVGKTMAALRFIDLLPPLERRQSIEVTRIYSIGGILPRGTGLIRRPPLRSPHHTASREGVIGGGKQVLPGEISYAHHGVLFLDEALEFSLPLLQSLREPLERGVVEIARSGLHYWFPARFQLILAANPCPCGKLGKPDADCLCSPVEVHRYWKKLGAALLDRIDLRIPVEHQGGVTAREDSCSGTAEMADRVERAISIQQHRFAAQERENSGPARRPCEHEHERPDRTCKRNADMNTTDIRRFCTLSEQGAAALREAVEKLGLSTRAEYSVLKIARTIADLEQSDPIFNDHLMEAVHYRRFAQGDFYWKVA